MIGPPHPHWVEAVLLVDNLPRNPSGKILKRNLRDTFAKSYMTKGSQPHTDKNAS